MKTKYKRCFSDRLFDFLNYFLVILLFIIILYPIYYVVIASFSKSVVGMYFWPKEFSLNGYEELLRYGEVWMGYANTIFYTIFHVLVSLACTLLFAYAVSRKDFVGRSFFTILVMIPMFFSGGLIPTYLTVNSLGLVNTRTYIVLAGAVSTYNIIIARTFFKSSIPEELYEAALLDGCGDGKFFTSVVLPLSKAIIAVEALYYGVGKWNSYMTELIYLRDRNKYSLSLVLRQVLWSVEAIKNQLLGNVTVKTIQATGEELKRLQERADTASVMQYCIIIASSLPMLLLFPYIQKYFSKGVMLGSVKG